MDQSHSRNVAIEMAEEVRPYGSRQHQRKR
jgi:hypothetical protein